MKNKVQLICYVDRLTGGDFASLKTLVTHELKGIFGGIHALPFYYPINGADAGFDPIDHTMVDPSLGTWADVAALGEQVDLVADLIVNHISAQSAEFKDYLEHGDESAYAGLFLTKDQVFPDGMTNSDLAAIYRPRPSTPFTTMSMANGEHKDFWTTFTSNQVDIDVHHPAGQAYLTKIIDSFSAAGVKLIRLDAVGYAIKKAGTSCFMIPATYAFIDELSRQANARGMDILVEIHSYYKDQIEIAKQVDYVYDFALPPLVLHAIYNRDGQFLKQWLDIRPNNAITVLDTHDGIGIVDVGPHSKDKSKKGILPEADIEMLVEEMHRRTNGTSRLATGAAASNLDLYQVNSTYYDALGQDDSLYLLARAIQFFTPGIPQVYYTGFLAEPNDMDLLARTNVGRDINRHYFTSESLKIALERPVVKDLIELIKIRNDHEAFNGDFNCSLENGRLSLVWTKGQNNIQLEVDFSNLEWLIRVDNKLIKIGE